MHWIYRVELLEELNRGNVICSTTGLVRLRRPMKYAFSPSFNVDIPGFLLFDSGRVYSSNGNVFEPMALEFLI